MMGLEKPYADTSRLEGGGVIHLKEALRGMQEMKVMVEGEGQEVIRVREQVGRTGIIRLWSYRPSSAFM